MRSNYWSRVTATRVSRRRALQAAGVAGAAGAGMWLVGCGGDDKKSGATATSGAAATVSSAGAPKVGGTYHAASNLDFATFDPHLSVGGSQTYFPRLYNALINRSPRDEPFRFDDLARASSSRTTSPTSSRSGPASRSAPNQLGVPERDLDANDVKATLRPHQVTLPQSNAYALHRPVDRVRRCLGRRQDVTMKTPEAVRVLLHPHRQHRST